MSSVVETVTEVVTPILEKQQFELVDMEFVKEGKNWFLRVFIDKAGGIDIDDCAFVSEQLSDILDELEPDPIPQAYFLEVSSPGAERPLKTEQDLQNALNDFIHLSLYTQVAGEKQYDGVLVAMTDETLTLSVQVKTRTKEIEFARQNIAKVRRAIQF